MVDKFVLPMFQELKWKQWKPLFNIKKPIQVIQQRAKGLPKIKSNAYLAMANDPGWRKEKKTNT